MLSVLRCRVRSSQASKDSVAGLAGKGWVIVKEKAENIA
jgi:hypothetical protein